MCGEHDSGDEMDEVEVPEKVYEFCEQHPELYPDMTWNGHKLVVKENVNGK